MTHARFEQEQWAIGDLIAPDDSWMGSWGENPLSKVERPDHCACCNQKLAWRVVVEHKTTGEVVVLGRRCAAKAGLPGVPKSDKDAQVAIAKRMFSDPEFCRWANMQRHPKGFSGTRLDDLRYWCGRKPKHVFEAVREFRAEGPVLAYEPEAAVALSTGKGAQKIDVRLGWTHFHRKAGKCWVARITGTCEQFGLKREFVAREYNTDGQPHFLTSEPGVYEMNSAKTRLHVRLSADGTAQVISHDEATAEAQQAA